MRDVLAVVIVVSTLAGSALAHEGAGHHTDKQMQTLHKTMKVIAGSEAVIGEDVSKGDFKAALKPSEEMQKASSALLKATPHKNADDKAGFRRAAETFRSKAGALTAALKSGDEKKVHEALAKVRESCQACHEKYRD